MIDLVCAVVVLYGLYCVYAAYGLLYCCFAYVAFQAVITYVPMLAGYKPVNASDGMWLVDRGIDRMIILGCSVVEKGTPDWFRARTNEGYSDPRFRMRPVYILGKPYWTTEKNFSIDDHIRVVEDPIPDKEALAKFCSEYYEQPLKPELSPWETVFIINYKENQSALLLKNHHALGDGMSIISQVITHDQTGTKCYNLNKGTPLAFYIMYAIGIVLSPYYAIKALLRKSDNFCLKKPPKTGIKYTDFTEPVSLQPIKDYSKKAGITLNTFLMSALCGAIRRYIAKHNESLDEITMCMPFSLRPMPTDGSRLPLSNNLSFLIWRQGIGIDDKHEREQYCNQVLEGLKKSPEPLSGNFVIKMLAGALPHTITRFLIHDIGKSISVNFTNVPGPLEPFSILGKEVDYNFFAANAAGQCAVTFGCYTYRNTIVLTCTIDSCIGTNVGELLELFAEEARDFS